MEQPAFKNLFADLQLPVLVFGNTGGLPVIYMNVQAALLFAPSHSAGQAATKDKGGFGSLCDMLQFRTEEGFPAFRQLLENLGHVDGYACDIVTFDYRLLPVALWGNRISHAEGDYFVLYLVAHTGDEPAVNHQNQLGNIINAAFLARDVDASIQMVIGLVGQHLGVSRVYVFEDISPTLTRNTYEWCAEGVPSAMQDLQNLHKSDYNYDVIMSSGMYIVNDVAGMPDDSGREILEAQGVQALAILPLYDNSRPMGYVGFDDTVRPRAWSHDEIQFLQSITALLATLLKRRNAEESMRRSQGMLKLLSDNSEDLIYVTRIDDHRLVFVSRSLADAMGKTEEELVGQHCWAMLQEGQTGQCAFCPEHVIQLAPGADRSEVYVWENRMANGNTYLAKDNIVRWVDGSFVHVETAADISARIAYEKQLQHIASTDAMTEVANRKFGTETLQRKLADPNADGSLCFLDIDGLKRTNDHFGHAMGDALILETIRRLRAMLREDEFICRWGGDEFILLLDDPVEVAETRLAALQKDMEGANARREQPYDLSFSFGVVPFEPGQSANLDTLITTVDALMYINKMDKRGQRRRRTDT